MAPREQIDREQLARMLKQNNLSLTKTSYDLGVSPQRVEQLCKELGIRIGKRLEFVAPQPRSSRGTK